MRDAERGASFPAGSQARGPGLASSGSRKRSRHTRMPDLRRDERLPLLAGETVCDRLHQLLLHGADGFRFGEQAR